MNFVSPDRLIWLWIAAPIVLFYLLKTRLRRKPVATLMFWDQLFEQKRQRTLLQRLRHWLSLLLQLIFVGLLVSALLDPLWQGQRDTARQIVLLLDNSASMSAVDAGNTTRLDAAKQRAQDVVRGLRDGDEIALVTAGSVTRVVVGMTDFGPAVRDAIADVPATDGPTRVADAIETARRLAREDERREIVVISDFCFDGAEDLENQADIRMIPLGGETNNIAVTQFQVRRSLVDPIGYAALVEVESFSDEIIECRLTIQLDDDLVDVIPLSLKPGEPFQHSVIEASRSGGVLSAKIDVDDALATDNFAQAILPPRLPIPVTLVTEQRSLYLESVLDAIPLVNVTVTTAAPAQAPAGGFVVLHRVVPQTLPTGPLLMIDPQGDSDAWKVGEDLTQPIVAEQAKDSPLLPHVRLTNVIFPGAKQLEFIGNATPLLIAADGSTLMASMVRQQGRMVVLSADLASGDLPLRIAFPVMMTNAVNWFLGRNGELQPAISTGRLFDVACRASAGSDWVWIDAAGILHPANTSDLSATVGPVDDVGIIELVSRSESETRTPEDDAADEETPDEEGSAKAEASHRYAVNLSNPSESDLRPRIEAAGADKVVFGNGARSMWFYLTILALCLIVSEWFLYQRRIVG